MPSCSGVSGSTSSSPESSNRAWSSACGSAAGSAVRTDSTPGAPAAQVGARRATVRARNRSRIAMVMPSSAARVTTRVADREVPPMLKKSSSMVTAGTPSTSASRPHRRSSSAVRGARPSDRAARTGAGSARRSSLPFGVSGSASSTTTALGTMYSGSVSESRARSAGESPSAETMYATRRLSPGRSSRIRTAARSTGGCASNAVSMSPSSMRKPRTLTWWSRRDRKVKEPSCSRRTRSPVR